jgi:hypothetical protein
MPGSDNSPDSFLIDLPGIRPGSLTILTSHIAGFSNKPTG